MLFHFFGNDSGKPALNFPVMRHIMSLLDPEDQDNAALVNNAWKYAVNSARAYMRLLPTIQRVPQFAQVGLHQLNINMLAGGMTNLTFKLTIRHHQDEVVMRIAGKGSSTFITRKEEGHNALLASELELNVPIVHFDLNDGLQISKYIKNVRSLDKMLLQRTDILQTIAGMMKKLHRSEKLFASEVAVFERNEGLFDGLISKAFAFPEPTEFIDAQMSSLKDLVSAYQIDLCPCHNDTTPLNFLLSISGEGVDEQIQYFQCDWEYANNNDFFWDLAYFSELSNLSEEQELLLLQAYFGEENMNESVLAWYHVYKPILQWWITLWSWTQLANQSDSVDSSEYVAMGLDSYAKTVEHLKSSEYINAVRIIKADKELENFSGRRPF